jgi:ribosomal protein L11 methyltransferase
MNYYEINLFFSPFSDEISEIVVAEFADLGCESFASIENGVNAYIAENIFDENKIVNIVEQLGNITKINYTLNYMKAQNWNFIWESNFDATVIDNICTVRAPFHNNLPTTQYEVVIMPKMSFGTGHHATTHLVAEALLYLDIENMEVLDMGCGTGILSIIAAMKNAEHIDAIDIDEWAFENARENIIANNVAEKIDVIFGDVSQINGKSYHLILANINKNIILSDIEYYSQSLKIGGRLIVSGIYTDDITDIEIAASNYSLKKIEQKSRDNWARIQFVKKI